MTSTRTPGQRAGLTAADVHRVAGELLAAGGAGSLSMRAVARALGVSPNALYSHVAGKDALVDGVLDAALAGLRVPARRRDPLDELARLMTATLDLLLARRELVPLFVARQGSRGPNAQRLGEGMVDALERAGVSGPPAREAVRTLIIHTIGFAAFATDAGSDAPLSAAQLRASFRRGLGWLLAGIEREAAGAG